MYHIDEELKKHVPESEIFEELKPIGLPGVHLPKMEVEAHDRGLSIKAELGMVSNLKFSLLDAQGMEVGLMLDKTLLGRLHISSITMNPGYQVLSLQIFVFLDSNPDAFKSIVQKSMNRIFDGNVQDMHIGVSGPVTIQGAPMMQDGTDALLLRLPLKEVIEKTSEKAAKALAKAAQAMMEQLRASVDINSDRIQTPVRFAIPPFIPIPKRIKFPSVAMSIGNGKISALDIRIPSLVVTRNDKWIVIETTLVVNPINTTEAAGALASSINPILGEPSKVRLSVFSYIL